MAPVGRAFGKGSNGVRRHGPRMRRPSPDVRSSLPRRCRNSDACCRSSPASGNSRSVQRKVQRRVLAALRVAPPGLDCRSRRAAHCQQPGRRGRSGLPPSTKLSLAWQTLRERHFSKYSLTVASVRRSPRQQAGPAQVSELNATRGGIAVFPCNPLELSSDGVQGNPLKKWFEPWTLASCPTIACQNDMPEGRSYDLQKVASRGLTAQDPLSQWVASPTLLFGTPLAFNGDKPHAAAIVGVACRCLVSAKSQ